MSRKITTCPACGSPLSDKLSYFDGYKILAIIHEGRSSIVCKAIKEDSMGKVSLRIFTEESGMNDDIADRLKKELEELKKLPAQHFVQHFAVKKSKDGYWYRISEWVDANDWGSVFISGMLNDPVKMITLFRNIASVLDLLHKQDHFMPYLILEDILIPEKNTENLNVKINYKLSRFLNARATHHGPMLQKLLECHPDIIHEHPINFKSATWSLGKIFVELLTADPNLKNYSSKLDELKGLHPELKTLLKIMLSDDPDLRPRNMGKVVEALSHILDTLPAQSAAGTRKSYSVSREVRRLKTVVIILMMIITGTIVFSSMTWLYLNLNQNKKEKTLSAFVETYINSTAFILVEYWLTENGQMVYQNKIEGTAFLADTEGYLLTNRHVACPWLDDAILFQTYHQYTMLKKPVVFDYKMYLWFEGAKAFNRLPALKDSTEISDSYYLSSAYSSGGRGNLKIIGTPRISMKTGEMIKAPFRNDFAVLKIDDLPENLLALPLDTTLSSTGIKRLEPILILGFPLGNRTQGDSINTSITRGHVRRTSKEIIQVDSSIYKGNSGGPAIDTRGKVIGIATGVVTDQINEYFQVVAPLSDFGLVLPIEGPVKFIQSIKKGQPQWDGILDFSIESKMKKITDLAMEQKFKQAADLSETLLGSSNASALLYAAGMMNFCSLDFEKSTYYFKKLLSIDQKNMTARLMLYIIDWIKTPDSLQNFNDMIFKMAWYEEDEYLGYLATVLKDGKQMTSDFMDYENPAQKSWRMFIEGLILEKNNQPDQAQNMFQLSVLNAAMDDWVYYLSFSRLNHLQENLSARMEDQQVFKHKIKGFREKAKKYRENAAEETNILNTLITDLASEQITREEKDQIHIQLLELAPENRTIIGKIAFYHAANNDWQESLQFINLYFRQPARETALSLSLNLLKAQILKIVGLPEASRNHLEKILVHTRDPWYRILIKQFISRPNKKHLAKLAGNKPEKLITLHTALGLWEESNHHPQKATEHYREALSSYLDDWNEYNLALNRIIQLRQMKR